MHGLAYTIQRSQNAVTTKRCPLKPLQTLTKIFLKHLSSFWQGPASLLSYSRIVWGGGVSMIHQATVRSKMPHASSEAIVFQWGSKSRMKDNNVFLESSWIVSFLKLDNRKE